ncbi:hypothetical protein MRX96_015493 [Rhipicephalus microplus]
MQAAELTDPSTLTLRIHSVSNTCTVSVVNQEDALKLVQLYQITYEQHEYAMTAYIVPPPPPDDSVRGVITKCLLKRIATRTTHELDHPQPSRNHGWILDPRRMGLARAILITFGQATVLRRIIYGGGMHLPYTPRVETCSNCWTIGHRTDVYIQPRSHKCPRCGQSRPKEASPKCTLACIICEGPHLSGSQEGKHRHLPKFTRCTLEREERSEQRVDHTIDILAPNALNNLLTYETDAPNAPTYLHGPTS